MTGAVGRIVSKMSKLRPSPSWMSEKIRSTECGAEKKAFFSFRHASQDANDRDVRPRALDRGRQIGRRQFFVFDDKDTQVHSKGSVTSKVSSSSFIAMPSVPNKR